jgi:hypothetical protein
MWFRFRFRFMFRFRCIVPLGFECQGICVEMTDAQRDLHKKIDRKEQKRPVYCI